MAIMTKIVSVNGLSLRIEQVSEAKWTGSVSADRPCCMFNYLKFQNRMWVNGIFTYDDSKFKGFGTQMIIAALEVYGEVYFCRLPPEDRWIFYQPGNRVKDDLRYPGDESLMKFASSLLRKQIIKESWIAHPFDDFRGQ